MYGTWLFIEKYSYENAHFKFSWNFITRNLIIQFEA